MPDRPVAQTKLPILHPRELSAFRALGLQLNDDEIAQYLAYPLEWYVAEFSRSERIPTDVLVEGLDRKAALSSLSIIGASRVLLDFLAPSTGDAGEARRTALAGAAYWQFSKHWSGSWIERDNEIVLASTLQEDLAALQLELGAEVGFRYRVAKFTQDEILEAVARTRDVAIAQWDGVFAPFAKSDIRFSDDLPNNKIVVEIDRSLATAEAVQVLTSAAEPISITFVSRMLWSRSRMTAARIPLTADPPSVAG